MLEIQIISASAGSGKTTRLARVLEEAVVREGVRPDAIVATTFTKKAAAELAERARRQLLEAGRVDDAQRLGAARIGTVNSVCDRLVSDFAFELGQPPQLDVLDEVLASEHLGRALGQVLPVAIERELEALGARMPGLDWRAQVWRLIETSRTNGLDDAALARCAQRSLDGALGFLGPVAADGEALDRALEQALDAFIAGASIDNTKTTRETVTRASRARAKLRAGQRLDWGEWASLANRGVGKKARELYAPVMEAAGAHDVHPALRADLARAIELVFDVARRTRSAYAELKRSWGVIDFVDQEVLALSLLRREAVRSRLADEIDLVLVDEFQDTSPLQLAIFLELARLAPRSIWVGDQKQAIYRFRGTDPALMNAALENLMADTDAGLVDRAVDEIVRRRQPETLTLSYRSRHELVKLTSAVFVPAFAGHGLPEARVRLEPALGPEAAAEAAALGPIVEHWPLSIPDRRRTSDLALALASGVRQLIDEVSTSSEGTQVRDRQTGRLRARVPADIAVLCRTNTDCKRVAEALEAQGIAAVLPRVGLLDTAEGRLMLAGLRRYIDPADRLAAAELARLTDLSDDADAWLARALERAPEGAEPAARDRFLDDTTVVAVDGLRRKRPHLGALDALDALLSALDLARRCAGWGFSEQRLANLEALRAHAAAYEGKAATRGLTPTPLGLLAYLLDLTEESLGVTREDRQATTDDALNAVTVSTWHRAKGLEWPVVVLFGLERLRQPSATGVYALGDRPSFDLLRPLDDRWVRFWPKPFHPATQHAPYLERLRDSPAAQSVLQEERREALRLLYVGWTRARDRLILAAQQGKLLGGMLGQLEGAQGALLHAPKPLTDDKGAARPGLVGETWAGRTVELFVRPLAPQAGAGLVARAGELWASAAGARPAHPPAFVAPSTLEGRREPAPLRPPRSIGEKLKVRGAAPPQALGQAMHGFLAAASSVAETATREAMARHLLAAWQVEAHLSPGDLLAAGAALDGWIETDYPGAQRLCEWSVTQRLEGGTCLRGVVDLVLALPDGDLVLVDHKTLVGAQAREHLGDYGGQLEAYARALQAATGRRVLRRFLHLPISAEIVEVVAKA